MTPNELVIELCLEYEHTLSPSQRGAWMNMLSRFNGYELDKIYTETLTKVKGNKPRLAHLWEAAETLGFIATRKPILSSHAGRGHAWTKTDCPRCAGEGRLLVRQEYNPSEGMDWRAGRPLAECGYSRGGHLDWKPQGGCYDILYACSCSAGDVFRKRYGTAPTSNG